MSSPVFLVTLSRTGPQWVPGLSAEQQSGWGPHATYLDALVERGHVLLGGPLGDEVTVVLAVASESEAHVRELLAGDPWSGSHLVVQSVTPWTIRLRAAGLGD